MSRNTLSPREQFNNSFIKENKEYYKYRDEYLYVIYKNLSYKAGEYANISLFI